MNFIGTSLSYFGGTATEADIWSLWAALWTVAQQPQTAATDTLSTREGMNGFLYSTGKYEARHDVCHLEWDSAV